jgi:hypothetical protein
MVLGAGVGPREIDFIPSPSLTSVSTAVSTLPFVLFRTSEFLLLSVKPMSRNEANFASKSFAFPVIFIPNNWLGLLFRGLGISPLADLSLAVYVGDRGGVIRSCFDRWNVELALRRLKPNFLPGLGGRGGGSSFQEPVPVLPVFCRTAGMPGAPSDNVRNSYFCRINLSMAESTMSASTGMSALTFFGFQFALLLVFPSFFMFSTCSTCHVSMLRLLTLLTCVPSLR